jgi:hypothetical protein
MAAKPSLEQWMHVRHNVDDQKRAEPRGEQEHYLADVKVSVINPFGHRHPKTSSRTKKRKGSGGNRHKSDPEFEKGKPFYGTENGSIDNTTASPDMHQAEHVRVPNSAQYEHEMQSGQVPKHEEIFSEPELDQADEVKFGEEAQGHAEYHDDQDGRHHDPNSQTAHGHELSQQRLDGNRLGGMDGDSYPDTTSGHPSTNAISDDEHADMHSYTGVQGRPIVTSRSRVPDVPTNGLPGNGHTPRAVQSSEAHDEQQHTFNADGLTSDLAETFTFAPANLARSHQAPAKPRHDQHQGHDATKGAAARSSTAAQPEPPQQPQQQQQVAERENGRVELANRTLPRVPQDQSRQPKARTHNSKTRRAPATGVLAQQQHHPERLQEDNHPAPVAQDHRPAPPPESQQQTATGQRHVADQDQPIPTPTINAQSGRAGAPSDPPLILDYTKEELSKMSYRELKEASFDDDPTVKDTDVYSQYGTLEEQMVAVARLPKEARMHFFGTLNIDQWEDAGDWFLQRFGEIAGKLKDVRREKRKFSQAFEDRIEQRHCEVSKKQEITQNALDAMRQSGDRVLDATPKKTKKKN